MSKHYFYIEDNQQKGPVNIDGLREARITRDTMVWYDGLQDWTPAGNVFELNELFYAPSTPPPTSYNAPAPQPHYQQTYQAPPPAQPMQPNRPMPKTWLVESILVTILCCLPFGIVAIINATKVENLWYAHRYEEAEKASRDAGKWTKWAFFLALIFAALYILALLIFPAAFIGLAALGEYGY